MTRPDSDPCAICGKPWRQCECAPGGPWFVTVIPPNPEAAYHDASFLERACDRCGKPYRGPAVYCSLECALADA